MVAAIGEVRGFKSAVPLVDCDDLIFLVLENRERDWSASNPPTLVLILFGSVFGKHAGQTVHLKRLVDVSEKI
jgi:hypothetical protein